MATYPKTPPHSNLNESFSANSGMHGVIWNREVAVEILPEDLGKSNGDRTTY